MEAWVGFAARLREVAPADDSQTRGKRLQQDRHGVGQHQDPQQLIAEARAAFQVGGPVAGVHVADADQVGGPGEGEHALPEAGMLRGDAGVDLGQRGGGLESGAYDLNYDTGCDEIHRPRYEVVE